MDISKLGTSKLRNFAIGGSLEYWQRNTTFSAVNAYAADRFRPSSSNMVNLTRTIERSTDVPTDSSSNYSLKYTVGTAEIAVGTDKREELQHRIEGLIAKELYGKTFTVSFWVKSSVTGLFPFWILNGASDRSWTTRYQITQANVWEKIKITVHHDVTGTWPKTNATGMTIGWGFHSGTDFQTSQYETWEGGQKKPASAVQLAMTAAATWYMTELMINEGSVAAPFVPAGGDLASELLLCQRYYEKSYDIDVVPGTAVGAGIYSVGRAHSSTAIDPGPRIDFKVKKRALPSMAYRTVGGASGWTWGIPGGTSTTATPSDSMNTSHVSTWKTGLALTLTTGNAYYVDGHWTADAEL